MCIYSYTFPVTFGACGRCSGFIQPKLTVTEAEWGDIVQLVKKFLINSFGCGDG